MTIEITTVPCLSDNYAFLIHNSDTGQTAVVDVPDAGPILGALDARGWSLTDVLLTHHHWDHVDGLAPLLDAVGAVRVVGAAADAHRLPPLGLAVGEADSFDVCGTQAQVFDVPGHTVGHIAFYLHEAQALFSGDSLMVMGCGRLFEGTPEQMWDTLQKLGQLPGETWVYSGHEYTAANTAFALTVDGDNPALVSRAAQIDALRAQGAATVPALMSLERETNPFLTAASLGAFTARRKAKDNF